MLGVKLSSDATFKSHVNDISNRMRSRTWALRDLKQKGMSERELVQVYTSLIRPLAEYAGAFWHSQLSAEQSAWLEAQQTCALRNIYGAGISAQKMRARAGINLLSRRREDHCLKFAQACTSNPRFQHWFEEKKMPKNPRRPNARYCRYQETPSRTDRHRNAPLNYLRRMLNRN